MSDSSPRTLTRRTNHGEVRKHKLKDGKSRWHHIKNKKEIYIHRKDYFANERSLTVRGLCFKASETVSWMLNAAVGARSSPRRKDLLHRSTAKKTNRKIKPLVGMEKFCLLRHFCLPSPSRECSALGPPSSAWREHLQWQRTPVIHRGGIWEETRAWDPLSPQLTGTLTHGSTRDPVVASGTPWHARCHQPALPPPATHGAAGPSPRPRRAGRYLVRGCGRVRRACGQRRALGRRRCRHPWGSPHPCPCACRWGPGGCHPSTWGGNQGPALQGRDVATSAPTGQRLPYISAASLSPLPGAACDTWCCKREPPPPSPRAPAVCVCSLGAEHPTGHPPSPADWAGT